MVVFLRLLEYYEGILFLTTNRIDVFDAAFRSRIHLMIKYHPLSSSTRGDLWRFFVNKTAREGESERLSETDLDELSSEDLNGRQIKNIVRTAHALALSAREPLRKVHILTALNATGSFDRDFVEERQENDDQSEEYSSRPRKRLRQH